jgi:predicted metal-binding protein
MAKSQRVTVKDGDEYMEQQGQDFVLKAREITPERTDRPAARIKTKVEEEDLEKLINFAKELGAKDGIAMSAKEVVTNELMRLKCRIPTCWGYQSSFFCPPETATAEEMRDIIDDYDRVLLLSIPPSNDPSYAVRFEEMNKVKEIVGRTEVEAQYAGYINSMGFTGGPCSICGIYSPEWVEAFRSGGKAPQCPLYSKESPLCLQYYRCRPAAQAVGIDMYMTAKNAGWEQHLHPPMPVQGGRIEWACLPGVYPILIG